MFNIEPFVHTKVMSSVALNAPSNLNLMWILIEYKYLYHSSAEINGSEIISNTIILLCDIIMDLFL